MSKSKKKPIQEQKQTNGWDVLAIFIQAAMTKGYAGILVIIAVFLGFTWIVFSRMESSDAKEVTLHLTDGVLHFPLSRPVETFMGLGWTFSWFAYHRYARTLKREIRRLVQYRRAFDGYKRKCYEFLAHCSQSPKIPNFEEFVKKLDPETVIDLKLWSSGYQLTAEDEEQETVEDDEEDSPNGRSGDDRK
jgi:uncharacterized membrane-anchored protein YitT (DUF2179 family)